MSSFIVIVINNLRGITGRLKSLLFMMVIT